MSRLPTFLGIGAPKCGTTWLAECLREHPQVFVPEVKEVVYFSSDKKARARRRLVPGPFRSGR
jgi:hypothetical protein